ncbi:cyclic lactone autoinducer peptide [Tyzzerella sp. OttesenSCG-928-J15]|nr:cyclic lactone autoinducer peptide [Tyzzerella sp. OttesenSCG-928-J15]
MKKLMHKLLPLVSSAALATSFVVFGAACRTWLYQPETPAKLLEMDK